MMDHEKASTGSSDPTVEEHLVPPSSNAFPNQQRRKWMWGGLAAAVVVFAVVFPTVYVTQQNNKNTGSSTDSNNGVQNTESEADAFVNATTPGGPFNQTSTLGLFDASVLEGYNDPSELKRDVSLAAWFLVGQVVQRNNGVKGYESVGFSQNNGMGFGGNRPGAEASPVAADTNTGGAATSGRPNGGGSDFGTNNQETSVEEGDLVVSDGQFVYAAYNDYLIVWNPMNGTMVAQVRMPDIVLGNQSSAGDSSTGDAYYWYPKPQIQALLLSQGRLLVVLSGYGQALMAQEGISDPVLIDYLNTHLRVYDTASLTSSSTNNPQPLRTANVQGTYNGVRATNGTVYLMALSGINTYTDLILPFEKWNAPNTLGQMNAEQYTQQAYETAQQEAIPKFVNKLVSELGQGDAGMPQLVRLSAFENEYSGTGAEDLTFPSGLVNTLALIHSFSLLEDASDPIVTVSSSGAFLPSYWAQFYGSTTHLIIAGQGQRVDSGTGYTVEATNFLAFRLESGAAIPDSIGSVDGYVINNYAIDVANDVLRVGVSINNQWFFLTEPMPMADGGTSSGVETTNGEATPPDTTTSAEPAAISNSTTENFIVLLTMPGPYNATEAGTMTEVGRLKLGKPNELFTALRFYDNIAYAVTFERTDPLYVLDLSTPSDPKVLAELNVLGFSSYLHSLNADNTLLLGIGQAADANGTTTGTKLSVYNAQNPAAPFVSAEYVISNTDTRYTYTAAQDDPKAGRYVPSMNTFAIPIDTSDWQTGYRFNGYWTFYVNATHILKECEIGHTYNESVYYVDPVPVDGGVATDPSTGAAEGSDGSSGGTSSGSGSGSDSTGNNAVDGGGSDVMPGTTSMPSACFYCAWLPPRAMIFSGNLMTINNHFIRSNDLDTCAQVWALDVVIQDNSTWYGCCGAYM